MSPKDFALTTYAISLLPVQDMDQREKTIIDPTIADELMKKSSLTQKERHLAIERLLANLYAVSGSCDWEAAKYCTDRADGIEERSLCLTD